MKTPDRQERWGWWRVAVILLLWMALDFWSLNWSVPFGPKGLYPGADPPWYFIRQDLANGIVSAMVLVVLGMTLLATRRLYPNPRATIAISMPVGIFALPRVATALVIAVRCTDLFSAQKAGCPWPTFQDYITGSAKWAGWIAIAAVFVALVPFWRIWKRRSSD